MPLREIKALVAALEERRPGLRPRLLALVRQQLLAVRHQSGELLLLQQELERILQRLLTSPRQREPGGCRCLEVEGPGGQLARRKLLSRYALGRSDC